MKVWVCCEIRARPRSAHRGYALEVDWEAKKVLRRFDVPPVFDPSLPKEAGGRWSRGLRSMLFHDGRYYALVHSGIFVLDESLEIIGTVSHKLMWGGHFLLVDGDGCLWHDANLVDAVVRVGTDWQVAEIVSLRQAYDLDVDRRLWTQEQAERCGGDSYHINRLQLLPDGRLLAFSCRSGVLMDVFRRAYPECYSGRPTIYTVPSETEPHDGCLVGGDKFVALESLAGRVVIAALGCSAHRVELPAHPPRGTNPEFCAHNYPRGLLDMGNGRILVGSSPLSLHEVDLGIGAVTGSMFLSEDACHTCHGLYQAPGP